MTAIKVPLDDPRARAALRGIESMSEDDQHEADIALPEVTEPPDTVFRLDGGYQSPDTGKWYHEFEVREFTGYDEEALGRIKEPGKLISAMVERGLVRVGPEKTSSDLLDGLVAGDWDTILLAIRIVTFGDEVDRSATCRSCGEKYEYTVNLRTDIEHITLDPDEHAFTVKGRRSKEYGVSVANGAVQRQILSMNDSTSVPEMNTILLRECVHSVNGKPVLSEADVRSIPLADRRTLIQEIDKRKVGPNIQGVMTKCPTCGNEQNASLSVAALFQG